MRMEKGPRESVLRLFKLSALILMFIAGVLLLSLIIYNLVVFKPNLSSIKQKVHNTEFDYTKVATSSLEMIELSQGMSQIDRYITNRLLVEMVKEEGKLKNWFIEYNIWNFLLKIYLEKNERIILWCELAPYEFGNGLNNSSNYHYNKSIDALNPIELIKLVIIAKSPRRFKKQALEVDMQAEEIYKRIKKN